MIQDRFLLCVRIVARGQTHDRPRLIVAGLPLLPLCLALVELCALLFVLFDFFPAALGGDFPVESVGGEFVYAVFSKPRQHRG